MVKRPHLTQEDRCVIEQMLRERKTIESIAKRIRKDRTTVSREIKKHTVASNKSAPFRIPNRCIHRKDCLNKFLCAETPCENNKHRESCRFCKKCNAICADFEENICWRLSKSPYVCNGCLDESKCVLRKKYYHHQTAHDEYERLLSQSRSGINISEEGLQNLDDFVSPLLKKGQSIHHIMVSNPDQFDLCEKTLYRYVDARLLTARNYHMPRIVRMKPRKAKSLEHKVDKHCRIRRSFPDFLAYMAENPDTPVVEIDTVLGNVGGKVLLTIIFDNCAFLLAFLRERNTSQSVIDIMNSLYAVLGHDDFCKLFPVILTDNGSEFSNPRAIEFAPDGSRRTRIFYCDPYSAFQKPHIEVIHELIRRVVPKGASFTPYSQPHIDRLVDHINSYKRKKLNDSSAFQSFSFLYGKDPLDRLKVNFVPPNEIVLLPELLSF